MIPTALFSVVLRDQTVGVSERQDEVSLVDEHGGYLAWRLADQEWLAILEAAAAHGHAYDFWHYEGDESEPSKENSPT